MHEQLPILYSFRRCPYAIRARLAIKVSRVQVELREVVLADKPDSMLAASAKGTVPILVLSDGTVIDESQDIMRWALKQHDPERWLSHDKKKHDESNALIVLNDHEFKPHLDHYKYAERFPEYPMAYYRQQGEVFLQQLEARLTQHPFLLGNAATMVDMAILPFVRQFAYVDMPWFDQSPYPYLRDWLAKLLASDLFQQVMVKYPQWHEGDEMTVFGDQG